MPLRQFLFVDWNKEFSKMQLILKISSFYRSRYIHRRRGIHRLRQGTSSGHVHDSDGFYGHILLRNESEHVGLVAKFCRYAHGFCEWYRSTQWNHNTVPGGGSNRRSKYLNASALRWSRFATFGV